MTEENQPESPPASFSDVLRAELKILDKRRRRRFRDFRENAPDFATRTVRVAATGGKGSEPRSAQDQALESDLVGLSFSGGGIRSATFNLGILQGLAKLKLLPYFDYLSTVSGGGYIGSWLTALLHREDQQGQGILAVQQRLQAAEEDRPGAAEDHAIRWLRQYSNYLTPKTGVLTADTWAVVATYLRNLLLNLTLLIAVLGILLLFPQMMVWGAQRIDDFRTIGSASLLLPVALVCALMAVVVMGLHMASFSATASRRWRQGWWLAQGGVQALIVLPLLMAAYFTTLWLPGAPGVAEVPWTRWVLVTALVYSASWFLSWLIATALITDQQAGESARGKLTQALTGPALHWSRLALAAPLAGAVGGALLLFVRWFLEGLSPWLAVAWGPPMILLGFFLIASLQVGFAGRRLHDHQREWLSRVAAWMLIYGVAWGAIFAIVVYGPVLTLWSQVWVRAGLTAGWLLSTLAGLWAARGRGAGSASAARSLLAKIAPYIFIGGLLMVLTYGLDQVLFALGTEEMGPQEASWEYFRGTYSRLLAGGGEGYVVPGDELFRELHEAHLRILEDTQRPGDAGLLFLILAAIGLLQGLRIDINEFSMHRLYRNRLVRCFLAASIDPVTRSQSRQPFTGFAPSDDLRLAELRHDTAGPFPIVNAALNLVGGHDLAWQERKATSFVFTPLFCGFQKAPDEGGYRSTEAFGNHPKPLTLGSALAISGAAASPNMGFRSSAALAFLLTVFNIRLGWWIGNPWRQAHWRRSGPRFAIANLFAEILGKTQDDRRFVYLSDGGHFENLGLYELVRRRCRFVLVCDAGADPKLSFDDLGNAIRKCRIDLGVEITLRTDSLDRGEDGFSRWHCAVGDIDYGADQAQGTLLYLKATLTGDEPEDLLNYAARCPEFPHQSTGDQWFDESQFESYRRLGAHAVEAVLGETVRQEETEAHGRWLRNASERQAAGYDAERGAGRPRPVKISFERLVDRLRERWYPRSQASLAAFSRHGETLEKLFERLRTSDELAFLDAQFYPEWQSLETGVPSVRPPSWLPRENERQLRQGFYFCSSLIQLMENVFLDLRLQEEYDHPDNRGWMNLFKHWSWSGMFQATWAVSAVTYGHRFQDFCQVHLGLEGLGKVSVHPVVLGEPGGALTSGAFLEAVKESPQLNFYEREIIRDFLRQEGNAVDQVWEIRVRLEDPLSEGEKQELYFGCGFALAHAGRLVCFRIQDHLRKAGLGRRGLLALCRLVDGGPALVGEPVLGKIPMRFRGEFTREGELKFHEIHRSVQRQIEEEEGPTTDSGIQPAPDL